MAVQETAIAKAAHVATYTGSGAAVYFGLTANEIAAFGGLFIAVVGLIVTWYYKHEALKVLREKSLNEKAMDYYE